jgi:transmembrane sensor
MSERRSFLDELRELDGAKASERLRPGAVHRIARRLDAELLQTELPARRRPWIPMVSFAAGAALVLAVFTLGGEPELATRQEAAPLPIHAAWQVGGDNCHVTRGEVELVLDGSCRVEPPRAGVVIESRATTRLRPTEHGVALIDGTALFEAMSGPEGVPWRVEVPGGVLELLATRLSVVVSGERGHVDLLEGSMRFVAADGRVHAVEPGERFRFAGGGGLASWLEPAADVMDEVIAGAGIEPLDEALEPVVGEPPLAAGERLADATAGEPGSADQPALAAGERLAALGRPDAVDKPSRGRGRGEVAPSSDELRRIVEQVAELRAQRQYQAAVSLLRDALGRRWDRRTREVLSYELGTILTTQLRDQDGACAHWTTHREQFPGGRYARAIARAEERLSCEER